MLFFANLVSIIGGRTGDPGRVWHFLLGSGFKILGVGRQPSGKAPGYDFINISRKLHEIEKNLIAGGALDPSLLLLCAASNVLDFVGFSEILHKG